MDPITRRFLVTVQGYYLTGLVNLRVLAAPANSLIFTKNSCLLCSSHASTTLSLEAHDSTKTLASPIFMLVHLPYHASITQRIRCPAPELLARAKSSFATVPRPRPRFQSLRWASNAQPHHDLE